MENGPKSMQNAASRHVHYTFGSVEVAYALLDKDGSSTVDAEEWSKARKRLETERFGVISSRSGQATTSMGYFGPSSVIYQYLPEPQRWVESHSSQVRVSWRRCIIFHLAVLRMSTGCVAHLKVESRFLSPLSIRAPP